nr:Ig-like domain-containing protein [Pseudomonas asiatica]
MVEPSNGSEISGTAEPGSTITLTDGSGNPIGQTTADAGSGNWSYSSGVRRWPTAVPWSTPWRPTRLAITSGQGSTTVDGVAPGTIPPSISATAFPAVPVGAEQHSWTSNFDWRSGNSAITAITADG